MDRKFVHLHNHSHYSLLNALPKIPELVKQAKKEGMNALALTDDCNMYGAIDFYQTCKKNDIKPIFGVDAFLATRTRHDKQAGIDNRRPRVVLLAENMAGYKNLIKLMTYANLEGFYYKPRIDHELMEKYSEGLICIVSTNNSEISNALRDNNKEKANELLSWYKGVYGADNLFLEITHHPNLEGHTELVTRIKEFSTETNTPLVAAHNIYYMTPDDKKARTTLMSVQTSGGASQQYGTEDDFSFVSTKDMLKWFRDSPDAIDNTQKIADRCNVELTLGEWFFPNFPVPEGETYESVLRKLVYDGISMRGLERTDELITRIEYELKVIKDKGYEGYFLVVADLLNFAHKEKILTTIRGSVAGSMVTFLARITNVNPFEYKLPFERFLNPERPSAPDIDMDFADNRRDEVIQYAREKYGEDKVAQIGTFGTMMARGSVRDTTRALGFPYEKGDQIAKLIPMGSQGFPMTITHALELVPELSGLYKKDADTKEIINMAKKIEGCARHISVHAAGVVIAPEPLENFVPVQYDTKGDKKIITQYDMYSVGEDGIGLLKFDFLGLKNLSILADAVDRIQKIEGHTVDVENVPVDDEKTFKMLARGETIGLFQLNGAGMTKALKELKPSVIHDINAMVALYRPGPMESIPQYVERKHNPKLVTFLDDRMRDILDQSYGVITYQDDVMMIAIKLAGYSWLEADKLRKAMGKKIPELMEEQKKKLFAGLLEHGMANDKAEKLWSLIEPFAAYGFNKAHAASYGKVAYQTAYMKAHFPAIYMSSVLTADSGDVEKVAEFITECKRMKIPVLPPDINESFSDFTVVRNAGEPDKIRFGLTTIKNFGEGIAKAIIHERKENGKFESLTDFLDRVHDKNLNKKSLEALIKAGAMDTFGDRSTLYGNLELLLTYNKESIQNGGTQDSLFGGLSDTSALTLAHVDPIEHDEQLAWEKELLGLYISGHPLEKFKEKLDKRDRDIKKIRTEMKTGMTVVVAGIVEEVKEIITKKNDVMAFVRVGDLSGTIECVIFPKVYTTYKNLLTTDNCIVLKGRLNDRNQEISLLVEKVKVLE
ncbi:DNA polymerase III subunit alpha [Candidatus Wolfebacteria bacterium]|nr:MAG: DNA polymerase III subunit alpha [Candidatus Wolfebacteria bacterium]